jgi:hypothetical protein
MLKFCCNLPNCNRRFATDRGLFQHKVKDPLHNRKKSYDSYNKVGKKRHFQMIQYEGNEKADSNLRKKPSTEPNKIDTDIMSNIIEQDDKIYFEDLGFVLNDDGRVWSSIGIKISEHALDKIKTIIKECKLNIDIISPL